MQRVAVTIVVGVVLTGGGGTLTYEAVKGKHAVELYRIVDSSDLNHDEKNMLNELLLASRARSAEQERVDAIGIFKHHRDLLEPRAGELKTRLRKPAPGLGTTERQVLGFRAFQL